MSQQTFQLPSSARGQPNNQRLKLSTNKLIYLSPFCLCSVQTAMLGYVWHRNVVTITRLKGDLKYAWQWVWCERLRPDWTGQDCSVKQWGKHPQYQRKEAKKVFLSNRKSATRQPVSSSPPHPPPQNNGQMPLLQVTWRYCIAARTLSPLFLFSHVPNFSSCVLIYMGTFPCCLAMQSSIQW